MTKKVYLQYRGSTPRPFNVGGVSGVFHPHGAPLGFSVEVAERIRSIFPECVVVRSEEDKAAPPAVEPVATFEDGEDTNSFDDYDEEDEEDDEPPFLVELEEDDDVPDESWTVKEIRQWLESFDVNVKPNVSKANLLKLVDRSING